MRNSSRSDFDLLTDYIYGKIIIILIIDINFVRHHYDKTI